MMRSTKSRGDLKRGSDYSDSARTTWIYSMYAAALCHQILSSLAKNATKAGEQHFGLGKLRLKKRF